MMKSIALILLFCVWMGGMLTSAGFIIVDLIRWVMPNHTEQHRLPKRFWVALAFFAITELIALRSQIASWIGELTSGTTNLPLILYFVAVLFILLLVLLFGLFLGKKIKWVFWKTVIDEPDSKQGKKEVIALLLTVGVILIYFLLPTVVGSISPDETLQDNAMQTGISQDDGQQADAIQDNTQQVDEPQADMTQNDHLNSGTDTFLRTWYNGAEKLAFFVHEESKDNNGKDATDNKSETIDNAVQNEESDDDGKSSTFNVLIGYTLFYVVLLGICFAATKIIYTILRNAMIHEGFTVWDQYSSAIGLLSVSISILLGMYEYQDSDPKKYQQIIVNFILSFLTVLFTVTIVILALETINLLLDMQRKIIRKEGKIIFVSIVGRITLIFMDVVESLAHAVESALGVKKSRSITDFWEEQKEKVIEYMQEEMEEEINNTAYRFPAFHVKATRK